MAKEVALKATILLGVPLFGFNLLADSQLWYWSIVWLDMVMHFLGGALTVFIFYFVFSGVINKFAEPGWLVIVLATAWAALIGVAWEWFEFFLDINLNQGRFVLWGGSLQDALIDLFFDILGAVVLVVLVRYSIIIRRHLPKP